MSTDNNPNETTNTQSETAKASQTQSTSTNASGSKVIQIRLPDKRFIWGAVAVLVLGGIVYFLSSSGGEKDYSNVVAETSVAPEVVTKPKLDVPGTPAAPTLVTPVDSNPDAENPSDAQGSNFSSNSNVSLPKTTPSQRVFPLNPEPRKGANGEIIDNNVGNKPSLSRVVIDDVAMVAKYSPFRNDGPKRYVFAGVEFFNHCHGRYLAPDNETRQYSRFKAAVEGRNGGWTFYIQPECLIEQQDLDEAINRLNAKHQITTSTLPTDSKFSLVDEVTITITLVNDDIKKKAADAINNLYNIETNKLTPKNIELIPVDDIRVSLYTKELKGIKWEYVQKGAKTQSYDGRDQIKVTIRDTVGNLINGLSNEYFDFGIEYALSGFSIKRNLTEQTIYGIWQSEILHDFYGKQRMKLKAIQKTIDAGGKLGWDAFAYVDLAGSLGAGYSKRDTEVNCDEWVEENDLMYVFQQCRLSVSTYTNNEFNGNDNTSLPDLSYYFKEPETPTIVQDNNGNYHLVSGNTGIPQSTLDKYCEFTGIDDSLKAIPKETSKSDIMAYTIEQLKAQAQAARDEAAKQSDHKRAMELQEQAARHTREAKILEEKLKNENSNPNPSNGNETPATTSGTNTTTGIDDGDENKSLTTNDNSPSGTNSIPDASQAQGINSAVPWKFSLDVQLGYGKAKKTVNYTKDLKFYHVQKTEKISDIISDKVEVQQTPFSKWVNVRSVTVYQKKPATYKQETLIFDRTQLESSLFLGKDFTLKGSTDSLDGGSTFTLIFNPSLKKDDKGVKTIQLKLNCKIQNKDVVYSLSKELSGTPDQRIVALGTVTGKYNPYWRMAYVVPRYNLKEEDFNKPEFLSAYLSYEKKIKESYNHARANNDADTFDGHKHDGSSTPPVVFTPNGSELTFFDGSIEFEGQHVIHYTEYIAYRWSPGNWWGRHESYDKVITRDRVSVSFENTTFKVPYVIQLTEEEVEYNERAPGQDSYYFDNIIEKEGANNSAQGVEAEGNAEANNSTTN